MTGRGKRGWPCVRNSMLGMVLCLVSVFVASAAAEPRPSPSPVSWELTFTFQPPQRISVRLAASEAPKTYWYMLYRVVNTTGEDRDFLPVIERVAEIDSELPALQVDDRPGEAPRLLVAPALVGLDPAVFRAIRDRHAKTHPFLVAPVESIGRIKQGADYAVDSVAIFEDLDPKVSRFTLYVGGLTGERTVISNPSFNAKEPASDTNPRSFVVQKTLAIPYVLPGDEQTRPAAEPLLKRVTWVMR